MLYGFLAGLTITILVFILLFSAQKEKFTFDLAGKFHRNLPLVYIIDCLPVAGTVFGYFLSAKHNNINLKIDDRIHTETSNNDFLKSALQNLTMGNLNAPLVHDGIDPDLISSLVNLQSRLKENREIELNTREEDNRRNWTSQGLANPRHLLIVPLVLNNEVFGVFELASFKQFDDYYIQFVERVAENTATTLNILNSNLRTEQFVSFTNTVNHTLIRAEYDTYGILIYANTRFLKKLGYSRDREVEGKHISMFIHDSDLEEFTGIWKRLSEGGAHFEGRDLVHDNTYFDCRYARRGRKDTFHGFRYYKRERAGAVHTHPK